MFKYILLITFALLIISCGPTIKIMKIDELSPIVETNPDSLTVLKKRDAVSRNYQPFAQLFVETSQGSFDYLQQKIKMAASKIGAEGLVGIHYSYYCGRKPSSTGYGPRRISALAVSFLSDNSIPKSPGFIVAIPPVIYPDTVDLTLKEAMTDDENIRNTAEYYFVKNGYYVSLLESQDTLTYDKIKQMDEKSLMKIGGIDASFICLIKYVKSDEFNIGIVSDTKVTLSSQIIRKDTREIVWENTGKGSVPGFGIVVNLFSHHEEATYDAVEKLFEKIPVWDNQIPNKGR
ncbi:MAG: hypothetical protein KGZ58_09040 [Ignavibacteriales bacterium]|nr:hypothetical protein [Ignavibacteriales bacterium]